MSGLLASRTRIATMLALELCALLFVLVANGGVAQAATSRTWIGGSGANWSTPANWNPSGPPANGDALNFPASAGTMATNNDIAALDVVSIEFAGGGYTVSGNAFTVDSNIAINQGASATISVKLTLGGPMTIDVGRFGTLNLSGIPQSIDLNGHDLTVDGDGQVNVAGSVTGTAGVFVLGSAALVYEAPTSYIGTTSVDGGILALDGGSIGPPGVTNVFDGGAFGGNGSVGPLTMAGALLFPGLTNGIGTITAQSLALGLATTARFRLNDFTLTGNDMVVVNGSVALGGAMLELRWAFDTAVGTQFTLISGATSLSGTFAGLPEGAIFTASGRRFSITYKGGAGHDVIITRLAAAAVDLTITDTPSATTFSPGQAVTYTLVATNRGPSDAPNVSVTTDLPAGLGFQSVTAPAGYRCAVPPVGSSGQVRCSGGLLAAGASVTITVVAQVLPGAAATLIAPAAVTSDGAESASADNSTTATIAVAGGAKPFHLRAAGVARD
jgi:uncharacterized repeat protein (TIGR01451 family)